MQERGHEANSSCHRGYIIYHHQFYYFMDYFILATMVLNMSNLEGEEVFESSYLGQADEVVQERISDDELIFIKG